MKISHGGVEDVLEGSYEDNQFNQGTCGPGYKVATADPREIMRYDATDGTQPDGRGYNSAISQVDPVSPTAPTSGAQRAG